MLQLLREAMDTEVQRLCSYLMKSARRRVKLVKTAEIEEIKKAISAEMAMSSAHMRLDLVENLLKRLQRIEVLCDQIHLEEQKDYQKRFGQ